MMKMKRKTRLAMALGGAVAGAAASGLVLAQGDEMGQIVTFPYYTVNGGWQTLFNVTNTTSAALAVKVRFHEAQNSRDVLDFNILMSPYDAWTGWLEPNAATGGVTLKTTDNSCTSPIFDGSIGLSAKKAAYTGDFADGGDDTPARLTEGYVELIVMGECVMVGDGKADCAYADANHDPDDGLQPGIGYLTEHVDGVPRDCVTADSYFEARDDAWAGTAVPGNGNPIAAGVSAATGIDGGPAVLGEGDIRGYGPVATWTWVPYEDDDGYYYRSTSPESAFPLKGNLTLVNIANGVAGGNAALHLGDLIPPSYPDSPDGAPSNLVTAQQYPWFLEPTVATAPSGKVWDALRLYYAEDPINEQSVLNEWSSNPDLGVATDWIVSFPTKSYHVDQFCSQIQAGNNRWRYNGVDALTCATPSTLTGVTANDYQPDGVNGTDTPPLGIRVPYPTLNPFAYRWADGTSDVAISYDIYDREEGTVTASGTTQSPAAPGQLPAMPYETNVVAFTSADDPNSAVASAIAQPIDASSILGGAPYGWMDMSFDTNLEDQYSWLPVTGFMLKTRTFGAPNMHYGQIQNHGYRPGWGH